MGLELEPSLSVVSESLANINLKIQTGLELSAKEKPITVFSTDTSSKHACHSCLKGELNAIVTASIGVDLIKGIVSQKFTLCKYNLKIKDFYYSVDEDEFGWSTCPYIAYKVEVKAVGENGAAIAGAEIQGTGLKSAPVTDANGKAVFYLENGAYKLDIKKLESATKIYKASKSITVNNGSKKINVTLNGSGNIAEGKCGNNITWILDANGTLTIRGSGEMRRPDGYWDCIASPYEALVKSVIIEEGITSTGECAFLGCSSLKSIVIPSSVKNIEDGAFSGCSSLESIYFEGDKPEIGVAVFDSNITPKAYYPKDNVTWDEKPDVPGNITWIPYTPETSKTLDKSEDARSTNDSDAPEPDTQQTASEDEIVESAEFETNAVETETMQMTETPETEIPETQTEAPQTETSMPETDAPEEMEVEPEGQIMQNSVEFVEASGQAKSEEQTVEFSNLVSGQQYVLVVLADSEAKDLFGADNLLYIAQQTADAGNHVSFSYIPKSSGGTAYCYGAGNKNLGDAQIMVNNLTWNGSSQGVDVSVVYDGTELQEDVDYRISGDQDVSEVGSYQVLLRGINDYYGKVEKAFDVEKTANAIQASVITKTALSKAQSVNIGAANTGKAAITITAAETDHYKKATKTIAVTVNAAPVNNVITASNMKKTMSTKSQSISLGAKIQGIRK